MGFRGFRVFRVFRGFRGFRGFRAQSAQSEGFSLSLPLQGHLTHPKPELLPRETRSHRPDQA